jgi:hypothetical protein
MTIVGIAIDILGWLGALVLVAAYSLISYGSIDGRSPVYQTLNVIGSILLIVNTAWHRAWPSSVVNLVWVGIAIGALSRGLAVSSTGLTPQRAGSSLVGSEPHVTASRCSTKILGPPHEG